MDSLFWARLHGATTHVPIALVLCSAAADGAGYLLAGRPLVRDFHAVGYWTMLLGTLGSVGAVVSGVMMTRGVIWGHGMLRQHHVYVWPAFGLIVGLSTWRVIVGRRLSRPILRLYLIAILIAAGALAAAGYWGGEMMLTG